MSTNHRIRIILSDVDETFLTHDKQLVAENVKAIHEAQECGIEFAFASGRYWLALRDWIKEFGLTGPQILDNGATLFDPVKEEVIYSIPLSHDCVKFFYKRVVAAGYLPVLCTSNCYYTPSMDEFLRANLEIHRESAVIESDKAILDPARHYVKLGVYCKEKPDQMEADLAQICRDAAAENFEFTPVVTEKGIFVLTAPRVDKARGVAGICDYLHCTKEEIAAVGDGDNDAGMLQAVGWSFAVANATPLAKSVATETVPANHDAGVAVAIRRVIAAQKK